MKWINTIGAALCVLMILSGRSDRLDPTPDPAPVVIDEQKPAPIPAPLIAGGGIRVLIIEGVGRETLPQRQLGIFASVKLLDWQEQHGAAWRVFHEESDTSRIEPEWRDALKLPHASTPWLIVSTEKRGNYSGPLPPDPDAMLTLLNQYVDQPAPTPTPAPPPAGETGGPVGHAA